LGIGARLGRAVARHALTWDAIVSHWLLPCALVGAAFVGRRRHLCIAHGSDVALLRRLPGGVALARSLARRADLVYVADALRMDGVPGRVVAMPGRDLPMPPRALARLELGIAPDEARLVALFVGRLVPEKGADLLLASLPEEVLALVVGDGPEHARLSATDAVRSGRARLLGARFGEALGACYAAADLLVVPSRRDGAPTVLVEARAARLPILATRVGGIPESLAGPGLLIEPGKRHAVATEPSCDLGRNRSRAVGEAQLFRERKNRSAQRGCKSSQGVELLTRQVSPRGCCGRDTRTIRSAVWARIE
jgi:glycosyltransferase involved in cell wall biosynthesis